MLFDKIVFNILNNTRTTQINNISFKTLDNVSIDNVSIDISNIISNNDITSDVSINNVSINDVSNVDVSNNEEDINEKNRILEFEKNLTFEMNDPYYYIKKEVLSKELCQNIIDIFEESEKHQGSTMNGIHTSVKKTYEVNIRGEKWKEIDNIISNILTDSLIEYAEKINIITNNNHILRELRNNITDQGYQIQKYIKGDGFYKWHIDFAIENKTSCRIVTFLFYLNDVEEGGETFFYNGKVKPEAGKLILFPATWTYNHKGNMPISNDKYIVTGWFYS
jgi:hypothetical protein